MSSDACTGGNSQYYFYLNFHFSPNSFSYRGSYFKLGGEGSQILWIRAGGGLSHRESLEVSSGVSRGQGS